MQETYRRAPIVEAVLDIRARLSSDTQPEVLEKLHDEECVRYPSVRHPFQVAFKFQGGGTEEPVTEASHSRNGYAFVSKDALQIFQARPDGFSHNRLAPYLDWESFKSEARRLWALYSAVARPDLIELLGLNYINKILIPSGAEIRDYLRTYVEVPADLPQMLEAHNLFIQMKDPDSGVSTGISVTLGPAIEADTVPVILNVQASRQVQMSKNEMDEDTLWATFEILRQAKNLAFESSITEQTRELFR